ncbi:bifunctional phosphoribosyl-AMP cyclohydrolase/phosphoribosyl-ATP diphosphatase HisIE [Paenibacillus endoradicis]|uniref:bifunctional phosphoribosyl-AMP cyclohydrolase/phosphoribosyl-ATP diphosphatase HisIE n=1 Tax=Paenibacillus endoradicis TaxID=2972487 RepID=UPI0021590839|nr:bifunctional phosphoribosyl-AMP cyclohydrolase/phosphoribosyl-ATP diphosphatase HisIE [Paenibacillus endoradicis]MCR8659718.1 bifunctional phosphoribosyl-AMP cyclohydrolase/phosphoribosyl-ATP diphosphatase HisIE [Paenibacillus endoradicis]
MSFNDIKWDSNGLVPTVVQDAQSKEVLMLAYMNEQSLTLSQESGYTWFWSRSRNELWNKGATSGHKQRIVSMSYDCDGDTLLVKVIQSGPACHTGSYSCFTNDIDIAQQESAQVALDEQDRFSMLAQLEKTIALRHAERPAGSYTTYLFDKGVDKILKKIGEESAEVIIATKNDDNDELRSEATDLIFHLSVLMRERGLSWDDIMSELKSREGKQTTNKMR